MDYFPAGRVMNLFFGPCLWNVLGICKFSVMLHPGSSDTVFMVLFKEDLIPDVENKPLGLYLQCS